MQVQADVRMIPSSVFASRRSLRFPRVARVRYDKAPADIQTDAALWAAVEANKGAIVGARPLPHALRETPGAAWTTPLLPWSCAGAEHLVR